MYEVELLIWTSTQTVSHWVCCKSLLPERHLRSRWHVVKALLLWQDNTWDTVHFLLCKPPCALHHAKQLSSSTHKISSPISLCPHFHSLANVCQTLPMFLEGSVKLVLTGSDHSSNKRQKDWTQQWTYILYIYSSNSRGVYVHFTEVRPKVFRTATSKAVSWG